MADQHVFAGAFVDRSGERRKDEEWLRRAAEAKDSCFLPVADDHCLVGGEPPACVRLTRQQLDELPALEDLVFLGLFREQPAFAFAASDEQRSRFEAYGEFRSLRRIGGELPADEANLAAHARALVRWHASALFCGRCGAAARTTSAGNARVCGNPDCGHSHFPRVDPAIIVLVERAGRCLLGRQASWPEGRYSTIAGFVEPGESLEDAVRREVYEETNIRVGRVRYHSSQPWPFPSSLMLGFIAEGLSDEIRLNDAELEDARWFSRDDLNNERLPYHISIARRLVDDWLQQRTSP